MGAHVHFAGAQRVRRLQMHYSCENSMGNGNGVQPTLPRTWTQRGCDDGGLLSKRSNYRFRFARRCVRGYMHTCGACVHSDLKAGSVVLWGSHDRTKIANLRGHTSEVTALQVAMPYTPISIRFTRGTFNRRPMLSLHGAVLA